ncbi:MAG: hypothetical protein NUK65_03840 [Firmicutes bacterium]|nr:hypothetical protein [Bacillota bacterium]
MPIFFCSAFLAECRFFSKQSAVIVEVNGRQIAASASTMPHDIQSITDNGFEGHFDIHFLNSTSADLPQNRTYRSVYGSSQVYTRTDS